jgi:hypothetical protein
MRRQLFMAVFKAKMIDVSTNPDAGYRDEIALRSAGMERKIDFKEKKIYRLEPPTCPICHKVNLPGSRFCSDCRHPLTQDTQEEAQTASQRINQLFVENPKALARFNELVKELKSPA